MDKATQVIIAAGGIALAGALVAGGILIRKRIALIKYKAIPLSLPEKFTYTAHTGCVGTPDNSLESFEAAVKNGADVVEFDLNFTDDGSPVLSHDKPKGNEISLDEAFEKLSGYEGLLVNVDVKNTSNLAEVDRLAKKHGISDRIFYTGVTEEFLDAVRNDTPEISYYLNMNVDARKDDAYINSLVEKVKESGAVGINFNKKNASKKLVDAFHKNGLLVSVWTANKESDMRRLLALAPDNITTRRPDMMAEIIKEC